jgi:hypothetical protein
MTRVLTKFGAEANHWLQCTTFAGANPSAVAAAGWASGVCAEEAVAGRDVDRG